jgi:hypothetical protein
MPGTEHGTNFIPVRTGQCPCLTASGRSLITCRPRHSPVVKKTALPGKERNSANFRVILPLAGFDQPQPDDVIAGLETVPADNRLGRHYRDMVSDDLRSSARLSCQP